MVNKNLDLKKINITPKYKKSRTKKTKKIRSQFKLTHKVTRTLSKNQSRCRLLQNPSTSPNQLTSFLWGLSKRIRNFKTISMPTTSLEGISSKRLARDGKGSATMKRWDLLDLAKHKKTSTISIFNSSKSIMLNTAITSNRWRTRIKFGIVDVSLFNFQFRVSGKFVPRMTKCDWYQRRRYFSSRKLRRSLSPIWRELVVGSRSSKTGRPWWSKTS